MSWAVYQSVSCMSFRPCWGLEKRIDPLKYPRKKAWPPFFAPCRGIARNGKQGRCGHTCYFLVPLCPEVLRVWGAPQQAFSQGQRHKKIAGVATGIFLPDAVEIVIPLGDIHPVAAPGMGTAVNERKLERQGAVKRGVPSEPMDGRARLALLHSQMHPGNREPFRFSWKGQGLPRWKWEETSARCGTGDRQGAPPHPWKR